MAHLTARPRERALPDLTAPVITEDGTWGTLPEPYAPPPAPRRRGRAVAGVCVLALALGAWLTSLAAWQLTARSVALPAHERGLAALAQVDALLQLHADALCTQAASGGDVAVPGFPVAGAELPAAAVPCPGGALDHDAARAALLARGAELVYLRGDAAFTTAGGAGSASPFDGDGAIRLLLGRLGADLHGLATPLAWGGGAALAALVATLVALRRRRALPALGWAALVAAAPLSLGAGLVRIGAGRLGGPDDPLLAEFGDLAAALLGVPLRLGVAAGLVGVAVLAAGGLGRRSAR